MFNKQKKQSVNPRPSERGFFYLRDGKAYLCDEERALWQETHATYEENQRWRSLLEDHAPYERWHDNATSERQLELLVRRGFPPSQDVTKGQAAYVLDKLMNKPTAKQRQLLEKRGLWYDEMTFDDARQALDKISREEGRGVSK